MRVLVGIVVTVSVSAVDRLAPASHACYRTIYRSLKPSVVGLLAANRQPRSAGELVICCYSKL